MCVQVHAFVGMHVESRSQVSSSITVHLFLLRNWDLTQGLSLSRQVLYLTAPNLSTLFFWDEFFTDPGVCPFNEDDPWECSWSSCLLVLTPPTSSCLLELIDSARMIGRTASDPWVPVFSELGCKCMLPPPAWYVVTNSGSHTCTNKVTIWAISPAQPQFFNVK